MKNATSHTNSPGAKVIVGVCLVLVLGLVICSILSVRVQSASAQDASTVAPAESGQQNVQPSQNRVGRIGITTTRNGQVAQQPVIGFSVPSSSPSQLQGAPQLHAGIAQDPTNSNPLVTRNFSTLLGGQNQQPGFAIAGGLNGIYTTNVRSKADMEFELKTRNLVNAMRMEVDDEKKDELEAKLETLLEEHFDQRMEAREKELEQIEERVKKLRDELDRRQDARDEIIRLRLRTLVNEANGLGF